MKTDLLIHAELLCTLSLITVVFPEIFADEIEDFIQSPVALDSWYLDDVEPIIPTSKRYASMSYSFGGSRGGRRGWRNRNGGRSRFRQTYRNKSSWRPWERLPDTMCYRKRCSSSKDCCKKYNKCNRNVGVCHDCWYGYPCKTSNDCCLRYPYCNPRSRICSGY